MLIGNDFRAGGSASLPAFSALMVLFERRLDRPGRELVLTLLSVQVQQVPGLIYPMELRHNGVQVFFGAFPITFMTWDVPLPWLRIEGKGTISLHVQNTSPLQATFSGGVKGYYADRYRSLQRG